MRREIISGVVSVVVCGLSIFAAGASDSALSGMVQSIVGKSKPAYLQIGEIKVDTLFFDDANREIVVDFSENLGYVPMSQTYIDQLSKSIESVAGRSGYKAVLTVAGKPIAKFLSNSKLAYVPSNHAVPFVYSMNEELLHPKKGLDGKIIAMWQSHGWYFEQNANRWQWQRARIFETVEDVYTQSYVMPFLMPMLENAGAYVMSPRERDINSVEIIIDNDGGFAAKDGYKEHSGKESWTKGEGNGFAYLKEQYEGYDNPFAEGSYRMVKTTTGNKKLSSVEWSANIPDDGKYAVYVSYASLPESADDAVYTIHSAQGDMQYRVNQQMGGGTWIYLGHFYFKKGSQAIVGLTNRSSEKDRIITADAVKIGGGYGNIARKALPKESKNDSISRPSLRSEYAVSGYPRFTEAARYWMQWAGIPDSVYSPTRGTNDYNDDYRSRGVWVNYLAGGSNVLPDRKGLSIPVDMSFAFHSDAGTTMNDSIIGTLGIYCTKGDKYVSGTDRMNSQKLTNYVMTNIVDDVRAQYDSHWVRRGMWDASYFEARVPEVPAMLLELLSHQNFADMRHGLDPTFRFTVSRAIYKGIVEYFANVDGKKDYAIQPLPICDFAIQKKGKGKFLLVWDETVDTLCDKAKAEQYIVYERVNDGGFKKIAVTKKKEYEVAIADNDIHSYQIVAANDGGVSFPSETLALGVAKKSKGEVLVINGFTRISAPDWFDSGDIAGFYSQKDNGVPYINDINYIGEMFEFRRELPWVSDESAGFGASRGNYETKVIAGNTFDYPSLHGRSIMNAGYSFVSSSVGAVESGIVDMKAFDKADLILGKQKTTQIGRGEKPDRYAIYSKALQRQVTDFCNNGGSIFVTGAYVASDVWDNKKADASTRAFAKNVLGYVYRVGQASIEGKAHLVATYYPEFGNLKMDYSSKLNDKIYAVESPDAILVTDINKGCTLMRYDENNIAAGVVNDLGNYRTCVVGFPFETITESAARDALMAQVLDFFDKEK